MIIALFLLPAAHRAAVPIGRPEPPFGSRRKQAGNRPFTIPTTLPEPDELCPASSQWTEGDQTMSDVEVFLPNMRGSCVTVGKRVHALFSFNWRAQQTDPGRRSAEIGLQSSMARIIAASCQSPVRDGRSG
jgi:hypothetical protein